MNNTFLLLLTTIMLQCYVHTRTGVTALLTFYDSLQKLVVFLQDYFCFRRSSFCGRQARLALA